MFSAGRSLGCAASIAHGRFEAALAQLLLELLAYPRLLLRILDLVPRAVHHLLAMARELRQRGQRQVAGGGRAHVEVLVEPAVGRREHAALVPRRDDLLPALRPHDGVALPGGDHDDAAGAVTVSLLVGAGREDRHVAAHLGVRERDVDDVAAATAGAVRDEVLPGAHVREEVAVPSRAAAHGRRALGDRVQVVPLRLEQLRVGVGVVEVEAGVRLERHGDGQVVVVQQPQRLVPPGVGELPVAAPGDQEERARAELEAMLRHALGPDGGDAPPAHGVDHLVQREPHRGHRRLGRDLGDARLGNALHAGELDERGVTLPLAPRGHLDGLEVFDEVAAVDRHALGLHPSVVHVLPVPGAAAGDLVLRVRLLSQRRCS